MTLSLWMLQNTLTAGCLAIVVAIVCRFGRFSPAVRHALWLLVLLKLVTPPLVEFPIPRSFLGSSLPQKSEDKSADSRTLVWIAAERFYDFSGNESGVDSGTVDDTATPSEVVHVNDPPRPIRETGATVSASPRAAHDAVSPVPSVTGWLAGRPWNRWLFTGWSVGTALFVLIQGRRLFNLRRMKRRGHLDEGLLTALVASLAEQMRVKRPPVWIVPDLPSPALCAWGRASLLWPEEAKTQFSEAGERAVVLHELAHLRRRDHWVGWLELVAGCVWWWNPLFWCVRHQLHENAELACDSWVVALLPEERRAYAEALIDVAQGEAPSPLAGVVLGVGDGSRKLMERRLIMIMRGKARYQIPAIGVAVLALIALATIPRWTVGKDRADTADAPGISPGAPADAPAFRVGNLAAEVPAGVPVSAVSRHSDAVDVNSSRPSRASAPDAFADAALADRLDDDDPFRAEPVLPSPAVSDGGQLANEEESLFGTGPHSAPDDAPAVNTPVIGSEEDEKVVLSAADSPVPVAEIHPRTVDQIKRLEAQLSAIQSELNSLRGKKPATAKVPTPARELKKPTSKFSSSDQRIPDPKLRSVVAFGSDPKQAISDDSVVETVVMTRSTYKLPPGRAAVLERALRELLNDEVEIKVKNESLQITAAQEDQDAIHQLIRLMQRKGREPANPAQGTRSPAKEFPTVNDFDVRRSKPVPVEGFGEPEDSETVAPASEFKPPERK